MSLPVIGITVDSEQSGGYSKFPWYALRENYSTAVTRAGGLPVLLPNEPIHVEDFLDRIDALVVTGGAFDVDPALFGAAVRHPSVSLKPGRTKFEFAVTRGALERDRLVTMKPTRGTSSPGCHSTLATTRRFLSQLPAR